MKPWDATELDFDPETFSGVARLFPLPNVVLYPHVMQPLHIFEERYREMLEDAMAGDHLIAMAVLDPGWEDDYESRPPVAQYACLGKMVAHRRLEDGRYNVLLLGVQRVKIVKELAPLRSFRQAKVELIDDVYDFETRTERQQVQDRLLAAFREHLPCACQLPEQLEDMLSSQLSLGLLTDLAAYALPLDADVKQQLLAECRVRERAEMLLAEVEKLVAAAETHSRLSFPPSFSDN
ncbi:MAG TPA: LON peptidase substrate-binding domain-containing protein [Lacipirellulaceae bacterium]|nr:LON peptidase substrate-binding domain-containing protein [Lacipirellulaceae bacterium]